jgi:phosphoribosylglycinamide formyltransferase 2
MNPDVLKECEDIAARVTGALGGKGLFGVEFFIKDNEVYFSEVSPRPHDTGMVTLISQNLSEFALHVRAFLGLPIPKIRLHAASASAVILPKGESENICYHNLAAALGQADTDLRLFGKPSISGRRRMGVALASAPDIDDARQKARTAAAAVQVELL